MGIFSLCPSSAPLRVHDVSELESNFSGPEPEENF